jgi:hypothetical protein
MKHEDSVDPIVCPVQPISQGAWTTWRVETKDAEPDFQRNMEPGGSGPSNAIDLTRSSM